MLSFVPMSFQAVIKRKYGQDAINVGDEGGFAPNIQVIDDFIQVVSFYAWNLGTDVLFGVQENKEGLELLKTAIARAGYTGKFSYLPYIEIMFMVLWLFISSFNRLI